MNADEYKLPYYESLTNEQLNKIRENSMLVKHNKHELIYSEDKPISYLMYLASGLVKIFKEDHNNRTVILRIVGKGNFIGLFTMFYGNRYQYSAVAIEDSEVFYISLTVFFDVISENGKFALDILKQFCNESMNLINKLIYFPQKQVPGRIAEVLLFFSSQIYGEEEYTLPLSRQELADLVYTTKESVSRTLTEFKNDRMIELDDRRINLKSIDLLKILSKIG